ncbi:MAG: cytochrome c peroxidase [bacterium]
MNQTLIARAVLSLALAVGAGCAGPGGSPDEAEGGLQAGARGGPPPPTGAGPPDDGRQPPPANQPPANQPPANQPPANQPPANQPPANQPPANQPPANQPPANQPPQAQGIQPRSPADNPTTAAKVALGRLLFWDPILSGPRDIACATCHHPDFAYGDGIALSIGTGGQGLGPDRVRGRGAPFVPRNAPTVLNTGFNGWTGGAMPDPEDAPMFWDSRAHSLEAQALGPIQSDVEMRGNTYPEAEALDRVVARLAAVPEYEALFAAAFGVDPAEAVTVEHLSNAIAAFERHLSQLTSPFDRFQAGDARALTAQQQRGLRAFNAAGCADCHRGPMFSDYRLHRLNTPDNPATPEVDRGDGQGRFRTPTLRNVALTGPYMHGGVFRTLPDVMRFYAARGRPAPGAPPPPGAGPADRTCWICG